MDIRPEDYEEIDELARARELIRIEEMRNRIHERDDTPYQNLVPCKSCGKACAPRDNGLCVFCDCAPAQEEKEMEPLERLALAAEKYVEKCDENQPLHKHVLMAQLNYLDGLHDPKPLADVLQERWDRAFFARACVVTPDKHANWDGVVADCAAFADSTIRRHAELMASRDAAIAEVVG